MSWIAVAVVGAGSLAAGGSVAAASIGSNAAKSSAAVMSDAASQAEAGLQSRFDAITRMSDPFRSFGLRAGITLEDLLVSPQERTRQLDLERADLEAEVTRLSQHIPDSAIAPPGGKNSSERWAAMLQQARGDREVQLQEARGKLEAFNKRAEIEKAAREARGGKSPIEASPLYNFQLERGTEAIERNLAKAGLLESGAGQRTLADFTKGLLAEETDRTVSRLMGLTTLGGNVSIQQGSTLGNLAGSIANLQLEGGRATASGILGVGQAWQGGLAGVANAATSSVGTGLQYSLYQNLINRNNPTTPSSLTDYANDPSYGSVVNIRGMGGQPDLLVSAY